MIPYQSVIITQMKLLELQLKIQEFRKRDSFLNENLETSEYTVSNKIFHRLKSIKSKVVRLIKSISVWLFSK